MNKGQFQKGHISLHTAKSRKKISDKLKGRMPKNISMIAGWNKGKKNPKISGEKHFMFGKHHSKESIEKMRETFKRKFPKGRKVWNKGKHFEQVSGDKNPNWKGGISKENDKIRGSLEYRLWENSFLSRDNHTCQKCKKSEIKKLVAHHILNFATYIELRLAIDNGITFCRKCHNWFHRKYGKKNNNRQQVEEFIAN